MSSHLFTARNRFLLQRLLYGIRSFAFDSVVGESISRLRLMRFVPHRILRELSSELYHLLHAVRSVELNPVRSRLVKNPDHYPWAIHKHIGWANHPLSSKPKPYWKGWTTGATFLGRGLKTITWPTCASMKKRDAPSGSMPS